MYYVYVLYSVDYDKTYVGFTTDLEARLLSHNHVNNKGWTKKYQAWEILYSEEFSNKASAMEREKELKTGKGRDYIKRLNTLK
jgi:putative endonuclease